MSMTDTLLVCVIHDKKFNIRLQTLNNLISKLVSGFKIMVIDKHNHEELSMDEIRNNVKLESPNSNSMFDSLVKSMHVKQVSQALKHKDALESFVMQDDFETMLVIEDDVLCGDNIDSELKQAIHVLNTNIDIDVLMLGCPTPRPMSEKNEQLAKVLDYFKLLPSCDSYLIKKDKARILLNMLAPIRFQLNTQLSFVASQKGFKMYMIAPNIFVNGSKYGVYVSSLDPNNKLFMNADFNKLMVLNAKTSYTQQEYAEILNMIQQMPLREHPDFQVAFGNFFMRIGKYENAKECYDNAYKTYVTNECILNNECEFMINYTKLFRYLQYDSDAIDKELSLDG